MNHKLFLIYFEYDSETPKLMELPIIKEHPKQYIIGSNPLFIRVLNKVYIYENKTTKIMTTSCKHIIVEGEENIQKGFDILTNDISNELEQLNTRLTTVTNQQQCLKDLEKSWRIKNEK